MQIVEVTSAAGMDCKMSLTFVAEKVHFILKKVYKMSFLYLLYHKNVIFTQKNGNKNTKLRFFMDKLIKKFRDIMPKRAWSENKDIYVMIDGNLIVYGQNGRFYVFKYTDENEWSITEYPRDIYGVREWHGYGKGWREI